MSYGQGGVVYIKRKNIEKPVPTGNAAGWKRDFSINTKEGCLPESLGNIFKLLDVDLLTSRTRRILDEKLLFFRTGISNWCLGISRCSTYHKRWDTDAVQAQVFLRIISGAGGHAPKILSISSHFVLCEAVSQKKYCCTPEVKHFGLAIPLLRIC